MNNVLMGPKIDLEAIMAMDDDGLMDLQDDPLAGEQLKLIFRD